MKRFTSTLLGAGFAVLLAGSANAQTLFTKSATGPAAVFSDNTLSNVAFTYGAPTPNLNCDSPGSDIVIANLESFSSSTTPDTFTNQPYAITLNILDQASGFSQNVAVSGVLNGFMSATQSGITSNPLATPLTFTLGPTNYVLSAPTFIGPQPPGSSVLGAIGMHVECNSVPEPSSLALLGTGILPLVGLVRRRK